MKAVLKRCRWRRRPVLTKTGVQLIVLGSVTLKPGRTSGLRSPEPAAEVMLAGIRKNRRKILVGRDTVRGDLLSRIARLRFIDSANSASR